MRTREQIWQVEKLVPGGAAMARLPDGSVGFVEGALPAERVLVDMVTHRGGFTQARLLRVLTPSPERTSPPCPIAERCGGCDWQHMSYAAQGAQKAELIAEALRRTGGLQQLPPIEIVPSASQLGYRSRIRLHIDEQGQLGFFEKRSHRVIDVTSCPVARPELDQALAQFRRAAAEMPRLLRLFEEVELRWSPLEPSRAVCLKARGEPAPVRAKAAALIERLQRDFSVAISGVRADFVQRYPLSETLSLPVSPHAFVQVNWDVNLALVERVVEGARARGVRRFLDAYAGAGNFTLPLAAAGLSGVSVEAVAAASRAARAVLSEHGFSGVQALSADAAEAFASLLAQGEQFDLIVLDPPRAGAAPLLGPLSALSAPHVAYCSCDPVTLARDLKVLCESSYQIESITGFDMFPGTHHVETLVWLRRR
ncbi:MAG: class I SAM-dependent RNA methyltransferase [Polyangiaceae bacterium]